MTPRFAPRPAWAWRVRLLAIIASLPLAGLLMWSHATSQQLAAETQQVQQQLHAQHQALRLLREAQQRQQQQQYLQQATPPALKMLDAIAAALPSDVVVRVAEVNIAQRSVRLEVNALSIGAVLSFNQLLQQLPAQVTLDNHRKTADKNSAWPVSAALTVDFPLKANDHASR